MTTVEPRTVAVTIFYIGPGGGDDFTMTFDEFVAHLQGIVRKVPEEFRPDIRIKVEDADCGDSSTSKMTIYFTRSETEAEMADRLATAAYYEEEREASERRSYEQLKAKYEGKP